MKEYFIKQETICGEIYHMIYIKYLWISKTFYERCNTHETAIIRLNELNKTS